jgi:hypothetical protein
MSLSKSRTIGVYNGGGLPMGPELKARGAARIQAAMPNAAAAKHFAIVFGTS